MSGLSSFSPFRTIIDETANNLKPHFNNLRMVNNTQKSQTQCSEETICPLPKNNMTGNVRNEKAACYVILPAKIESTGLT